MDYCPRKVATQPAILQRQLGVEVFKPLHKMYRLVSLSQPCFLAFRRNKIFMQFYDSAFNLKRAAFAFVFISHRAYSHFNVYRYASLLTGGSNST